MAVAIRVLLIILVRLIIVIVIAGLVEQGAVPLLLHLLWSLLLLLHARVHIVVQALIIFWFS